VLTLSKLGFSLLLIALIRVQPTSLVFEAIKLSEVQCNRAQIILEFVEHESLKDFEWVILDPSLLLQVLINLLYVVYSPQLKKI
jgi:signal transduction histidine kinase